MGMNQKTGSPGSKPGKMAGVGAKRGSNAGEVSEDAETPTVWKLKDSKHTKVQRI